MAIKKRELILRLVSRAIEIENQIFASKLCNLVKIIALIVFSVPENIGLPGCFVKI